MTLSSLVFVSGFLPVSILFCIVFVVRVKINFRPSRSFRRGWLGSRSHGYTGYVQQCFQIQRQFFSLWIFISFLVHCFHDVLM